MPDIVRYAGLPALYEAEDQKQNQVGFVRQTAVVEEALSVIPADRRLLAPPLVTSHRKLLSALTAMSRLALTEEEAGQLQRRELTCVRVSFDGDQTIVVEGANRAEHGVVRVKAKCRQPSAGWSVLVHADGAVQTLASLPNQPLEVAPGERFHIAGLSVAILEGDFPAKPTIPVDVNDGELKDIAFQAIVSKNDLKSALAFCAPIIKHDERVNLQNLVISPELKIACGTDAKRANMLKVDIRSKARLSHPVPFMLTLSAARASTIVDEDDFVFISVMTSGELVIAGRTAQSYSIVMNRRMQTGLPWMVFDFWPSSECSEFVVKRQEIVAFCEKAHELFLGAAEEGAIRLYFGEKFLRAEAVQREVGTEREDIDWQISYVRTTQLPMVDRRMFFRPDWFLELLQMNKGEEATMLLPRNSKSADHLTLRGDDVTKMSILLPINPDQEEYADD